MMQEFTQQIKELSKEQIDGIHTALPGKIVEFDASSCEATVLPSGKLKKPDGMRIDFPQITNVPVLFPQGSGQNVSIVFPINPGDGCLIIISEFALDTWRHGDETDTDLRFDLTNAIAIVGLFSKANTLVAEALSSNSVIVASGSTKLSVSPDGVTVIGNLTVNGNVTLNGSETATGDVVASGKSLASHTHAYSWTDPGGSGNTSSPN